MRNVLPVLRWDERKGFCFALAFIMSALSALPGYAALSFNGISAFNVQETGKKPVITLQSDMPVHYRIQTVNANQVKLLIYQAQFARELVNPDNTLNLPPNRLIEQASLQKRADTLEILLTGPNLGQHLPGIQGGILEGQTSPAKFDKTAAKPVVVFPQVSPTTIAEAETTAHPANASQDIPNTDRIEIENTVPEPASKPVPRPTGPTIMATQDAPDATEVLSHAKPEAFMPSMPEAVESRASFVPEPNSRASRGPIQAITFNEQGQPVQVIAKNAAILQIGQPQHTYNALFQDEAVSPADQSMSNALAAYHQNQLDKAEQEIQKALRSEPNNDEFLATLAEIQIKRQQLPQACATYKKAIEQKPGQYELRYAQTLTRSGQRSEAVHALENALQLNPQNPEAIYMLGTLNQEMGNNKTAILYLEQAATLSPDSSDILYNLGLAYEFSGNFLQARDSYRKALALSPNATDITTALHRVAQ